MSNESRFSPPPTSYQLEILATKSDKIKRLESTNSVLRRAVVALSLIAVGSTGASVYAISKEKVYVAAYSRDEVGFEHVLFLDTMRVDGDSVMMAIRHFVEDWRAVTSDPEHNKFIRWRAFARINIEHSERLKVLEKALSALPPQTENNKHVTYVQNITVTPRILNGKEWRVDWQEVNQDISVGSSTKLKPEITNYSADFVVTIVQPSEEFPDGVMFEPMMPEPVPLKNSGENKNAANM